MTGEVRKPVNIELVLMVPVHEHPPRLVNGQGFGVGVVEQVFVVLFAHGRFDLDDLFMNVNFKCEAK